MKAFELQVGDYVEIQDTPRYYKVTGINLLACELQSHDNIYTVHTWCDRVMPIVVSPELLKKIGFEFGLTSNEQEVSVQGLFCEGVACQLPKRWVLERDEYVICVTFPEGTDYGMIEVHNLCIDSLHLSFTFDVELYLHTLQQAARLCGVDILNNIKL